MRILITGSSGFLGKHIVEESIRHGHDVLCLKHSDIDLCLDRVKSFSPEILVHFGWGGVESKSRDNSKIQAANIDMSMKIVQIYPFKQIIVAGSQDEYGILNEIVDETYPVNPVTEYAKAKVSFCSWLQEYAGTNHIEWQWLRIFNIYGIGQSANWLIPAVIKECNSGRTYMNCTKGEQRYAYLNVEDLGRAVVSIYGICGKSGIYNLSSSNPQMLKDIFEKIKKLMNSDIIFNYGTIPYRNNQSMTICGNSEKFKSNFGEFETVDFDYGLKKLISNEGV